jgi:hypothetical protein
MDHEDRKDHKTTSTDEHMPAMAMRPGPTKGKRAKVHKPTQARRPLKLSIDAETYEKLAIHGLRRGQTISEIVTDLATKHLNDWVLHAKPGARTEAG